MKLKKVVLFAICLLVGSLSACTNSGNVASSGSTQNANVQNYSDDSNVLNIVAGSEQKTVIDQLVRPWCKDHKTTCNIDYLGSVDQARLLQSGNAPYDAFWFASSVFEQLGDQNHALQDVKPISVTPVVYAGWKSEMEKLGFVNRNVSIKEVMDAIESKQTKTWITNPTQSNSGATVYFGFLNYFAGNGPSQALTADQLASPDVQSGITRFVQAFDQTPPSSGTLMNDCVAQPDRCRTMFTYEDLVIEKNKELVAQGKEPLYVVYPQGSLAISDAPLGFLPHGANSGKQSKFNDLQQYLLSADTQHKLLDLGRRPSTSFGLSLSNPPLDVFNPDWGIQANLREQPLNYPSGAVIQAALGNYQTNFRTPSDTDYCLDGSGSTADNGAWDGEKQAADLLFDPAKAGQYLLQVNPKDRTTVNVFNDGIKGGPWTVAGNNDQQLIELKNNVQSQSPGGGTGIDNCLDRAATFYTDNPDSSRKRLVILMTDGQDSSGGSKGLERLIAMHIPVIAIGFGNAVDEGTLKNIAGKTGGAYIRSSDPVQALRSATSYK